jgi:hypothetical protein
MLSGLYWNRIKLVGTGLGALNRTSAPLRRSGLPGNSDAMFASSYAAVEPLSNVVRPLAVEADAPIAAADFPAFASVWTRTDSKLCPR